MYIVLDTLNSSYHEELDKDGVASRVLELVEEEGIHEDYIKILQVKNQLDFDIERRLICSQLHFIKNKGL